MGGVTVTLEGDAAILLWLEGKEAWNKWMEENPKAKVDFVKVDFSYEALKERFPNNDNLQKLIENNKDKEVISFSEYEFSGKVNFRQATFSGEVYFRQAKFSDSTGFSGVKFSSGAYLNEAKFSSVAYFHDATFSGEAGFSGVKFSSGAYFHDATFSGEAYFDEAIFSGEVNFRCATFSGGKVFFSHARFSSGADFNLTKFSYKVVFVFAIFNRKVYFRQAEFSSVADFISVKFSSAAYFDRAKFNGQADFHHTTFSGGASFSYAIFNGKASFGYATFSGIVDYINSNFEFDLLFEPLDAENIKSLNFKGAGFEKLFTISGNYNCIPDLRQTKTRPHVDLSNLKVKLNRSKWPFRIGLDNESLEQLKDDAECLCRLKEIAESNKNNEKALAFHADEMRAKRLWNWKSWPKDILDFTYSVTSNYGQSIFKPFIFLVFSILMFAQFTMSQTTADKDPRFKDAVTASIATATPFISISKGARDKGLSRLYGENTPDDYDLYSYLHAGLSFIFIFLIGLGLRNRFRI